MKTNWLRHITLILLFIASHSFAQNVKFTCITSLSGTTDIQWVDNAGCTSYTLFHATNKNGPYTNLGTVTTTNFSHTISSTLTSYYYLLPNCTSETDTIDNLGPVPPEITSVSINANNEVTLNWLPSESGETEAYEVFLYDDANINGGSQVATITGINNTTFTHLLTDNPAMPDLNDGSAFYEVFAADYCNNAYDEGQKPDRIQTTNLTPTPDRCSQTLNLTWDAFNNWSNPVRSHHIYTVSNGTRTLIDSLNGNTTSYTIASINDGVEICLQIEAHEQGTGSIASSNVACVTPDVVKIPKFIHISNLKTINENAIQINYYVDSTSDVKQYKIYRRKIGSNFSNIKILNVQDTLGKFTSFLDEDPEQIFTSSYMYEYQVGIVDSCNNEHLSNIVNSILLEGEWKWDYTNDLHWTKYQDWDSTINHYQVWREADITGVWNLEDTAISDTFHKHNLRPESDFEATRDHDGLYCYKVYAKQSYNIRDASFKVPQPSTSISNKRCIQQDPPLYIPNVFSPNNDGVNDIFKPLPIYIDNKDFEMTIYDRWGKVIFVSNDLDIGWDGTSKNEKLMPVGMYWYTMRFSNPPEVDGQARKQYITNGGRPSPVMLIR